ncbi:MAG TPA: GNAT family N-acetyltransferase [Chloroflexota bacterium]|jgi:predicted N-acetyltransferase YhbS|nr:GNAT family N-acetyltransferase [Chloroflexota bacterium]
MIAPHDRVARPVERDEEIEAFYRLAVDVFHTEVDDREQVVRRVRRESEAEPGFNTAQRRGIFQAAMLVGRCMIHERVLRVGEGRLLTACIDGVATHPEHRLRGVGRAIMEDAIACADARGHALLLLDGIANFYDRFGFTRVFDLTDHAIYRPAMRALPAAEGELCRVRPVNMDDAPDLLGLYERHMAPYTGSFTRTLVQQEYHTRQRLERGGPSLVAEAPDGSAAGYLFLQRGPLPALAIEIAADTWPAAAALLRRHADLLDAAPGAAQAELTWMLPPNAPLLYRLVDHLVTADTSRPGPASVDGSVRSHTYLHRSSGWMARVVSLSRLINGLLPAWRTRLTTAPAWSGSFSLQVAGQSCRITIDGSTIMQDDLPSAHDAVPVVLTPRQLAQLAFGYRPISFVSAQTGAAVPAQLVPLLSVLFPCQPAFIPASDWF